MWASIKKNMSKLDQESQQNKQNQLFSISARNKYLSISEPNFTKSERKVRFGQNIFENDPIN